MGILDDEENSLTGTSYRYVWMKYGGYNPYGATCIFSKLPLHPTDCNCEGTGVLIHRKQMAFHENPAPYRALISGGGGGKTMSGSAELVKYAIENPGSKMMIVAPTFPMLHRAAFDYFVKMLPPGLLRSSNQQRHEIVLTNGCKIWMASAENPDSLRGPTVAAIWIDEASYLDGETFDILMFRLRQTGYPLKIWITTTPRGKNWVYERWIKDVAARPDMSDDWWHVRFKTDDNPWFPRAQLKTLRARLEGTIWGRQELDADFVGFEGQIYPQFDERIHVGDFRKQFEAGTLKFKTIIYGVDWGYTDPTCIFACGVDYDRRLYLLEEVYKGDMSMQEKVAEAKALVAKYGPGRFICDSAGQEQISTFNRAGLPANDAYKSIEEGITYTASRLVIKGDQLPRILIDKSCKNLLRELPQYHYKERKEGDYSKPVPAVGQSDHAVDTLRYIVMELDGGEQGWGLLKSEAIDSIVNGGQQNRELAKNPSSFSHMPKPRDLWRGFGSYRSKRFP